LWGAQQAVTRARGDAASQTPPGSGSCRSARGSISATCRRAPPPCSAPPPPGRCAARSSSGGNIVTFCLPRRQVGTVVCRGTGGAGSAGGRGRPEGPRWRGGAPPPLGTLGGSPANIGGGGSKKTEEQGQVEQRTDRHLSQRNRPRKSEQGFIWVGWVDIGGSRRAAPSTHRRGGKLVR
jgi:hypothetical protein